MSLLQQLFPNATKQNEIQNNIERRKMEKPMKRDPDEKGVYLVAVWHRGGEG